MATVCVQQVRRFFLGVVLVLILMSFGCQLGAKNGHACKESGL